MSDQILIVGGAGYIGSHVALAFAETGAQVTVLDNLSTGRRSNLQEGMELIEGDILDPAQLAQVFERTWDGVVHLAALKAAGESMLEPEAYARQNLIGSLNLLEAYASQPDSKLIFSSTAAVYGMPQYLPMDEAHPTVPINFYGYTKLQIEGYLGWYARLRGLKYAALRYFNAAGYDAQGRITGLEHNPQNLIPIVMETALGQRSELLILGDDYDTPDGTGVRDYIHVSDLARGHVAAYGHLKQGRENLVINLGAGQGYSVQEVVDNSQRICGRPIPRKVVGRREGDAANVYASAQMAADVLDWKVQESDLENMLKSTWDLYIKQNP
ncbi:MAG: UDP-glucose 4-epimerase GalE [bacterium]|nr:UDP-glucose 4-epimerase GalE [bacterium]